MYKIVRMYFDDSKPNVVIETGLTLEEAQEHCRDPETSSSKCTSDEGHAHTAEHGPWFEGYEDE